MNGKIASLPKPIREQLNRRLDDAEPRKQLLDWLNSLPEVKTLLAAPQRQPISRQNLYEWTQHGFRDWKMRQNALDFAALQDSDDPDSQIAAPLLNAKLVQWLALRFAASAHTFAPDEQDPDANLRRLSHFAAHIVALRRGDLYARRIALEEKRLALMQAGSDEQREAEFWQWTKRPDISAQLLAKAQKTSAWHDLLRATIPEIAPFLPKTEPPPSQPPDENPAPAATIPPIQP